MKLKNFKMVSTETTEDIICDSCGESCKVKLGDVEFYEYMELKTYWGYASNKDGEEWIAHVCEKCVDDKLSFINFEKNNYM
jgi:hypothetical protein